jgi:hypothetical protein
MGTMQSPPLPLLPCPHCNENILEKGFHNNCTETQSLREDNHTGVWQGRLVIDHDEDDYQMIDHQCDVKAYCTSCEALLPWPLYVIRGLDGKTLQAAAEGIAEMLRSKSGPAVN